MKLIIGLTMSLLCIFGSFVLLGGNVPIILKVLPLEMVAILGGGIGSVIINYNRSQLMATLRAVVKASGSTAKQVTSVEQLLDGLREVLPEYKMDPYKFERQVEEGHYDALIARAAPRDHDNTFKKFFVKVVEQSNIKSNGAAYEYFNRDFIKGLAQRYLTPSEVLRNLADVLPALGIVVAVLGIVKSMGALSESAEILGELISGALVGTMLGIFLSYCVFGPLARATRLHAQLEMLKFRVLERVFEAIGKGATVSEAIEHGRAIVPLDLN